MSRWPANKPEDVWKSIDVGAPEECWPHTKAKTKSGYGYMRVKQITYLMHRVVYWLTFPGEIDLRGPKDKSQKAFILHKCDNPKCCNPNHLFLGSHTDNMRDMVSKGRNSNPGGERHPSSKLTNEEVIKIREMAASGIKMAAIGRIFNVTRYCIWDAVNYRTYRG